MRFIVQRVLNIVPLLLITSFLALTLTALIPGGAASVLLGDAATPQAVARLNRSLGLDAPIPVQYWHWLDHLVHGNFGTSIISGQPVSRLLGDALPLSLWLMFGSLVIAIIVGIVAGVVLALRVGRPVDYIGSAGSALGLAIPSFWLGLILSVFIGVKLHWLPSGGYVAFSVNPVESIKSLILPWVALALPSAAVIARQTRSSMVTVLATDYIRSARASGVSHTRLIIRHALKNALVPVVTVAAFQLVVIIGSSFVVEIAFGFSGIGSLTIQALTNRDLPVVQGTVIVIAVMVVAANLVADLVHIWIDPRIRT
ncbi:MAG: ABC transporter permease [Acidimicrobiales bacterium]